MLCIFSLSLSISFSFSLSLPGAEGPPAPQASPEVLIRDVPHIRQKPDFCGEACAAMILRKLGKDMDQDFVFERSGLDPLEGRGCWTRELVRALQDMGFETGPVWHEVQEKKAAEGLERIWSALLDDLKKGIASIVCTRFDGKPGAPEHFRLVLGYRPGSDEVVYHESAEDRGAYLRMKRSHLFDIWPLKAPGRPGGAWTVIRIRLEPGKLRTAPLPPGLHAADWAQHIRALREKLPRGFTLLLEKPFVVLGDEPEPDVRLRAERTVRWAVDHLKKDYFAKDPEEIIDIWLFRDDASYRRNVKEIFGDTPTTPFGYYSAEHHALIMNIGTGGGTLVHEIVHPFIRANFPGCPAWLNEGLGSLYEQSAEKNGHIRGLTNWRLAGLQEAIQAGKTVPFDKLLATTDGEFYADGRGVHYAQARYLCHHLQEKGLLVRFYKDFLGARKEDPTGAKTLRKILGTEDLKAFQKDWEASVLKLRFP